MRATVKFIKGRGAGECLFAGIKQYKEFIAAKE